jgi:A/G-specific adenine glycosylase
LIWQYYVDHGRVFPWRQTHNPYHILVSEIMLQQTQTSRVLGKYEGFIEAFPDFATLAEAPPGAVLEAWQGLGYNRRAVALHRTAQSVTRDLSGELPSTPGLLARLPGIGPYTASAVAAIAFNQPVVLVETNVRAVFMYFFFEEGEKVRDREILPLVEATIDRANPREWYYGLFDYGAMLKKTRRLNARSAHYRKQGPFEGSNRQMRGRILRLLLARRQIRLDDLVAELDASAPQVRQSLMRLHEEGFLEYNGDTIHIL